MIIFISDGRLGNQLFQYAFLRRLSKGKERILAFRMQRLFEGFEIDEERFHHFAISARTYRFFERFVRPILLFLNRLHLIAYITQKKSAGIPQPEYFLKNGWLPISYVETQFFQSQAFFPSSPMKLEIKKGYLQKASQFLNDIPDDFSKVFVHIRRGDYLRESFEGEVGIDLPLEYYRQSISKMKENVDQPFFIFLSDDITFCINHFSGLENKIFSDQNMYVDLSIMALCDHGILANSSFSWWGAYLMKEKGIVYYPRYWYGWKKQKNSHPGIEPTFGESIEVNHN